MAEPRTDLVVAERFARVGELGRGGTGTAWRAHDTLPGQEFSERLLREARAPA